jgi:hypothetical protein
MIELPDYLGKHPGIDLMITDIKKYFGEGRCGHE